VASFPSVLGWSFPLAFFAEAALVSAFRRRAAVVDRLARNYKIVAGTTFALSVSNAIATILDPQV
jgi:hypothetical protein